MKKIAIIVSAFIGVVLFSFFLLNYLMKLPCDPPERHKRIPGTAVWSGGCDGGFWFEQVSYTPSNHRYRIRIYNDFDGNLEVDAEFGVPDTCKKAASDKIILSKISVYNGEQIILKGDYCNLNEIRVINDMDHP